MIIRCEELQKICSKILLAVDSNVGSAITETLAISTDKDFLYLGVTNREYFVKIKLKLQEEVDFKATVDASLFLKLISKMTTETIEFNIEDNHLVIKGNGSYKLPMIYENDTLLELPEISIDNVTSSFSIDTKILNSIVNYNSKELAKKGVVANPVQTMYYLDDNGCITFTTGACVNKFTIPSSIKILLNDKIVKLFKLFNSDKVQVDYGQDSVSEDIIVSKLKLSTDNVELIAIINSNETMINSVPADVIRNMAFNTYDYAVVLNKKALMDAIDRISLFLDTALFTYGSFKFTQDKLLLSNKQGENIETIYYGNEVETSIDYEAVFDLYDLKLVLSGMKTDHITMNFGNGQSAVLIENNIYNIIPECVV